MRRLSLTVLSLVVLGTLGCGSDEDPAGKGDGAAAAPSGGSAGTSGGTAGTGGRANGGAGGNGTGGGGASSGGASSGGATGGAMTGGSSTGGASGSGGGTCTPMAVGGKGALPDGDNGMARCYPGDTGIADDASVVFADDFESYTTGGDLEDNWSAVYQMNQIRMATETENVFAGAQSLEFTVPEQDEELSNATDKVLTDERDLLFLRYYSKFQPPYNVVGSSHNGSMISAHYFINGNATPGVRADGMNKFLVNYENWRGEAATDSPGDINVYVYHPEQRDNYGDHFFPNGDVMPNTSIPYDFGPEFVERQNVIQDLDRWYCYEYMVRANTPGERDGRIAFWLDGVLLADFQNLRLRDIESLKIDRFGLSFHIGSNPNGETKKWYDNVVAASSYIGPRTPP
jgi:hypothetical protein